LTFQSRKLQIEIMTGAEDQFKFIETVLAKTGWSQTDLANRAGLDPSTLSRFLTKGRDGHALRPSSIRRISNASSIAFGSFEPAAGLSESEAEPYDFAIEDERALAIKALIGNSGTVNAWRLHTHALENLGYRPGDVLFVGLGETPFAGDIVCAQIYDWVKGQAETVFRLYQPPALIGASNDPLLLKPYLLGDNAVVVKGVVLHTLRSRS
jgi:transcriptional regulator with XRE-family HTH domain